MHPLTRRLSALLADADMPTVERVGRQLADAYADPPRHYHDAKHALFVHGVAMTLLPDDASPAVRQTVGLAALWHDAIYVAGHDVNEAASAALAIRQLDGHVDDDVLVDVARLIVGTSRHQAAPDDLPASVLYDADLSPLGKPRQAYWSDNASIRAEYGFASDTQWREGRAEFIRSFLDRPHIFHTGEGIRRFEQQARDNLHDELDVLTLEAFQTPPSTAAG